MTDPGGILLDRAGLERAFTMLGDRLVRRGVVADLFVVGGSGIDSSVHYLNTLVSMLVAVGLGVGMMLVPLPLCAGGRPRQRNRPTVCYRTSGTQPGHDRQVQGHEPTPDRGPEQRLCPRRRRSRCVHCGLIAITIRYGPE